MDGKRVEERERSTWHERSNVHSTKEIRTKVSRKNTMAKAIPYILFFRQPGNQANVQWGQQMGVEDGSFDFFIGPDLILLVDHDVLFFLPW